VDWERYERSKLEGQSRSRAGNNPGRSRVNFISESGEEEEEEVVVVVVREERIERHSCAVKEEGRRKRTRSFEVRSKEVDENNSCFLAGRGRVLATTPANLEVLGCILLWFESRER